MHPLLGGISNSMNCRSIVVGGAEDNVQIPGHQASTVALADWVKDLKPHSRA
jgi:hypothetical protein